MSDKKPKRTVHLRPRYYRWFVEPDVEWVETNTGYATLDWQVPIDQSAVVLIDVWECHYLQDTSARSEQIIQQKIRPLLAACRQHGLQLIHAPAPNVAKHYLDWRPKSRQTPEPLTETNQSTRWPPSDFRRKSGLYTDFAKPKEARQNEIDHLVANRQMHPDVRPEGADVVVADGQELHRFCSQRQILFLFYIGFNTNACILMRDYGTLEMSKRGYEIIVLRDCTTGMESHQTHDLLWQTRGAVLFLEMFGKHSITSPELIDALATSRSDLE
jgi:nicotinamidase-related amidase